MGLALARPPQRPGMPLDQLAAMDRPAERSRYRGRHHRGGTWTKAPHCGRVGRFRMRSFASEDCPARCPVRRGSLFSRIRSLRNACGWGEKAPTSSNQRSAIDPANRTLLRRFAIAGIIERNDGIVRAHIQDGMVSMCELTLKDDLLQIAQRRRHARDALAELDEVILDELLTETDLEQPRLKVPHIPPVKSDLGDVIAAEQATQMIGDELIRHGLAGSRLQETAVTPKIIRDSIGYRPLDQSFCW